MLLAYLSDLQILLAQAKTYGQALACRFFMGLFEVSPQFEVQSFVPTLQASSSIGRYDSYFGAHLRDKLISPQP